MAGRGWGAVPVGLRPLPLLTLQALALHQIHVVALPEYPRFKAAHQPFQVPVIHVKIELRETRHGGSDERAALPPAASRDSRRVTWPRPRPGSHWERERPEAMAAAITLCPPCPCSGCPARGSYSLHLSHHQRYRQKKDTQVKFAASPTAETPLLLVRKYLAS